MQKHYLFFFVYLIAYLQVSPAVAFNTTKLLQNEAEDSNVHLQKIENHPRQKRFIGALIAIISGIITAAAATIISTQVNRAIERSQQSSNDKASVINIEINNNYARALQFKEEVTRIDGNAGRAIQVNPNGFYCDNNLCSRLGDGQHTLGLCSPDICHCSNGAPNLQQCGTGTVFDPLFKVCNWPYNVRICGY